MKLTQRNKNILGASVALALGLVVGVALDGDDAPTRAQKLAKLGADIANGSALGPSVAVDAKQYHEAVRAARDADPALVDLLTGPVAPGETVTTGVNLPLGASIVGDVMLVGPAQGQFRIDSITRTDRADSTWIEVKATNTGTVSRRFVAMIEFGAPP